MDPSVPVQALPVQVDIGLVGQVSSGSRSTCVLLSANGAVRCWGQSLATEFAPEAGDAVRSVVVAGATGCVVLQSDTVRCWGQDGTSAVVPVSGVGAVDSIALAETVSCVISPEGVASCWGANDVGQLGRGTTSPTDSASAPVSGVDGYRQLAVSNSHVCGLRSDGSVWCWGGGSLLGTYKVQSSALPVPVDPW